MTTSNTKESRARNLAAVKRYRARNPMVLVNYMRRLRADPGYITPLVDRAIVNAAVYKHRKKHPEQYSAQRAVLYAVRVGKLIRQLCFICGEKAQAHHASYAKDMRLAVTWLCDTHHKMVHKEALDIRRMSSQL